MPQTKHEIWLVGSQPPATRRLLFVPDEAEADYDPEILVSPDERWIARNQKRGSTEIRCILHQRDGALNYPVTQRLDSLAWEYAASQFDLPDGAFPPFHRTLLAVRWIDSTSLLLVLRGDRPGGLRLNDWHCVYHPDRRGFTVPKEFLLQNRMAFDNGRPSTLDWMDLEFE